MRNDASVLVDSGKIEPRAGRRLADVLPLIVFVVFTVALLVLLYHHILAFLFQQWIGDPNYSHGLILPFFSGWIVWQRRKSLSSIVPAPAMSGIIVIAGALGILILGVFGAELYLSRTSFLLLLAGIIIYFAGWKMFRALLLPWAVLFLAIPLPAIIYNQLTLPLQFGASRMASGLLSSLGMPVLREGNVITLSTMTLDVAEACSGLRSLMSLVALATIYGCLFEKRVWRRLVLIVAAVPIAIVANAVRIMGTGVLGVYWGPRWAEGFFHLFSGMVIFVCSLLLLLAVHASMRWFGKPAQEAS
jgi:exosortase